MSLEAHDIKKEVRNYIIVFAGLLTLTVITVLASNFKIGITFGVVVALIVATVKGALVARNFMHLKSEQNLVYLVLILAAIFFASMMFLIVISYFNVPEGLQHVS
jgi:cytochrome c oxidase subunit 4